MHSDERFNLHKHKCNRAEKLIHIYLVVIFCLARGTKQFIIASGWSWNLPPECLLVAWVALSFIICCIKDRYVYDYYRTRDYQMLVSGKLLSNFFFLLLCGREWCASLQLHPSEKGGRWARITTQQSKGRQQSDSVPHKHLSSQRQWTKQRLGVCISAATAIWLRGIADQPVQVGLKPTTSHLESEMVTLVFSLPSS